MLRPIDINTVCLPFCWKRAIFHLALLRTVATVALLCAQLLRTSHKPAQDVRWDRLFFADARIRDRKKYFVEKAEGECRIVLNGPPVEKRISQC